MAEYIKREATIKAIVDSRNRYYNSASNQYLVGRCDGLDIAAGLLRVAPAADVAPVVHTRWACVNKIDPISGYRCSKCRRIVGFDLTPYCPNCGAKMDGGESDEGD